MNTNIWEQAAGTRVEAMDVILLDFILHLKLHLRSDGLSEKYSIFSTFIFSAYDKAQRDLHS